MKKREGFVSNSSSTSFICSICGREREFIGDVEPSDVGWYCCKGDHAFEPECLPRGVRVTIEESEDRYNFPKEICPICNGEIIPKYLVMKYIEKTADLSIFVNEMKSRFKNLRDLYEFLYPDFEWDENGHIKLR